MKDGIHPAYYPEGKITCACGNVVTAGSTVADIQVDVCSKCHPFYSGKQKMLDTARRVEKFSAREAAKVTTGTQTKRAKTEKRAAQKAAKKSQKKPTVLAEV